MGPLAAPASLCTLKSGTSASNNSPDATITTTPSPVVVVCISYEHVAKEQHQAQEDDSQRGGVELKEAMDQLAAAMTLAGNQSNIRAIQFGQTSNFTDVKNCEVVGSASSFVGTATEFVYALNDQCNALVEEVLALRKLFVKKTSHAIIDVRPCCPDRAANAPIVANCTTTAAATDVHNTTTRSHVNVVQPQDGCLPKRPRTDDFDNTITTTTANNC
jgi:hypothetical protein